MFQKHGGLPTSTLGTRNQTATSPVHILQETASNLADAILGVGEKIKSVQEGHTPPWGLAVHPIAPPSPDIDSCKEVSSQGSENSSVASPEKEQSDGHSTIILDSPDTLTLILPHMAAKEDKEQQQIGTSNDMSASRKLNFMTECSTSGIQAVKSDSTGSPNKLSSLDGLSLADIRANKLNFLSTVSKEDDDIVFSPKNKKVKKKRIKPGTCI